MRFTKVAFVAALLLSSLLRAMPAAAAEQSTTLFPVADSYTSSREDSARNYGREQKLILYMDFGNVGRALIRFDLSTIPANATITSATLGIEQNFSSGTSSVQLTAYRVMQNWTETSVTRNTEPVYADDLGITIADTLPNKKTFDVTTAAQNWKNGVWQNFGVIIFGREGAPSSLNYQREFASRESGTPPTLVVVYTLPADQTGPVISNVAAAAQTDGSVRVTWRTDEPATASVEYGATAEYGRTQNDVGYALEQSIALTGLAAGTYHYRVRSADTVGNTSTSGDNVFTIGTPPPPTTSPPATGETSYGPGDLVKLACPAGADVNDPCKAVYYLGSDSKRHAFPNAKIYNTWFADFSTVKTMPTVEVLSPIPLGANIRYKPGVRMIKFATLAKVYAVSRGGVLRWVTSEAVARDLYGADWNKKIDDLSDAFATNYTFGADITSAADFNVASEQNTTIDADLAVRLSSRLSPILSSQLSEPGSMDPRSERGDDNVALGDDIVISTYHEAPRTSPPSMMASTDTTPPHVTSVFGFDNSEKGGLTITWDTNESATGVVEFGATTSYGQTFTASQYSSTTHVIVDLGSIPPGTYHFRIRATDTAGNIRTTGDFLIRTDGNEAVYQGGRLVKLACSTGADANDPCKAVYYVGYDSKRHAFPNAKVYRTWYLDFSSVQTVSAEEMSSFPLGANVRYKPGVRMLKFATDPKVYAVRRGGGLQWITSESLAFAFYSGGWNQQIDDLSDAFAGEYSISEPITDSNQFSPQMQISNVNNIEQDIYPPLG